MRMTKTAISYLPDTFEDRIITARQQAEDVTYFPGAVIAEGKKIWEELEWAQARGWISPEEAREVWEGLEARVDEWLMDWEEEDLKEA